VTASHAPTSATTLARSRKARILSLAARRPKKSNSPNRQRLIARATVWTFGLMGAVVVLPMMLH
jgi:hypothetical protein